MPYVITTTIENAPEPDTFAEHDARTSRRAVATLEECVTALVDAVDRQDFTGADDTARGAAYYAARRPITCGTVSLPDGTVIEVAPWPWDALAADVGLPLTTMAGGGCDRIIDAYNAREATR